MDTTIEVKGAVRPGGMRIISKELRPIREYKVSHRLTALEASCYHSGLELTLDISTVYYSGSVRQAIGSIVLHAKQDRAALLRLRAIVDEALDRL